MQALTLVTLKQNLVLRGRQVAPSKNAKFTKNNRTAFWYGLFAMYLVSSRLAPSSSHLASPLFLLVQAPPLAHLVFPLSHSDLPRFSPAWAVCLASSRVYCSVARRRESWRCGSLEQRCVIPGEARTLPLQSLFKKGKLLG